MNTARQHTKIRSAAALSRVTLMASCLAVATGVQALDKPFTVDETTRALYRFDAPTDPQTYPDLSGHSQSAVATDHLQPVPIHLAAPGFQTGLTTLPGGGPVTRDPVVYSMDAGAVAHEGAFSIDIRCRLDVAGGYLFRIGTKQRVALGVSTRNGGLMMILYTYVDAAGVSRARSEMLPGSFEHCGPLDHERFHVWSFVYDGDQTFHLYRDGVWLKSYTDPDLARLELDNTELQVGRALRWGDSFHGTLAEIRVSTGARAYTPAPPFHPADQRAALASPLVGFDLTTADSPVEPGYLRVTTQSLYEPARGYGWSVPPLGDFDFWFTGDHTTWDPDTALQTGVLRARRWLIRDGHEVADGASFRVDLPPGRYAVCVHLGRFRVSSRLRALRLNGALAAEQIVTDWRYVLAHPDERTIRAIADVGDQGLEISFEADRDAQGEPLPICVLGLDMRPFAPAPVTRADGALRWSASEPEPAGFAEAAALYAAGAFRAAADAARAIESPLARCAVWAWIIGYPNSSAAWQLELFTEMRATLQDYCAAQPGDQRARSLLDAADRFRDGLIVGLKGHNYNSLYIWGMRIRKNFEAVDQCLQMTPEDPFYGKAMFLAGSFIYWRQLEEYGVIERARPNPVYGHSFDYFRKAREAYPQAALPRIYLGEQVPHPVPIVAPADAPAWAALSYRTMHRVMDVIRYWTDERMAPDGQLGGGWGDDVEALRWWAIGPLVCDDDVIRAGWRRMADSVWRQHPLGYPAPMADVEHNAEPLGDTQPFMPFIEFGTPRFEEMLARLKTNLPLVRDLWTGITADGFRMFRSYYFGATEVQDRDGDFAYNTRALHMLANYAYWTGDPEARRVLSEWALHWAEGILREGDGKPAGLVPQLITFKTRRFVWGQGAPWTAPGGLGCFTYPTGHSAWVYHYLVVAFEMTGNEAYLEPIRAGLRLLRDHPRPADPGTITPGSIEHYLYAENFKQAPEVIAAAGFTMREIANDTSFDDVLATHGNAVVRFRVAFDRATDPAGRQQAQAILEELFTTCLETLDYNLPLRTTEPKSTDRVRVPGANQLVSLATGRIASGEWGYPFLGVSWEDSGRDLAFLVTRNQPDGLEVFIYNFLDEPKTIGGRLWRLKPGSYDVLLAAAPDWLPIPPPLTHQHVTVTGRGQLMTLTVPSRQVVKLTVAPAAAGRLQAPPKQGTEQ